MVIGRTTRVLREPDPGTRLWPRVPAHPRATPVPGPAVPGSGLAPVVVPSSRPFPTRTESATAASRSHNSSAIASGTYSRFEPGAHLPVVRRRRSSTGFRPWCPGRSRGGRSRIVAPSSKVRRFRVGAALAMISRPVATDPVKDTLAMSGWVVRRRPTSSPPQTTCRTPGGSTLSSNSPRRNVAIGVKGDGLTTTVLPARSAGAIFHSDNSRGLVPGCDGRDHPEWDASKLDVVTLVV